VRDEQEKHENRKKDQFKDEIKGVMGGYSGSLHIGSREYAVLMAFTEGPEDKDKRPTLDVWIKRSDLIIRDASLRGRYSSGSMSLVPQEGYQPGDHGFSALIGDFLSDGRVAGVLKDSKGEVGSFEVYRDFSIPRNLNLVDFCHPFLKSLRQQAFEISGVYVGAVNPDATQRPPYEVNVNIQPSDDFGGSLEAEYFSTGIPDQQNMAVVYFPHMQSGDEAQGVLKLVGSKGVYIDVRRISADELKGKIRYPNGRANKITFKRTRTYVPSEPCSE
jgi:hypothetical protein